MTEHVTHNMGIINIPRPVKVKVKTSPCVNTSGAGDFYKVLDAFVSSLLLAITFLCFYKLLNPKCQTAIA